MAGLNLAGSALRIELTNAPDEKSWIDDCCVSQSKGGTNHEADHRALTKDGDYLLTRNMVHVIRNVQGEVKSLVGLMLDISERKNTEENLITLQKKLEEFSFNNILTGVANRRMFDSIIEVESVNARRNNQPILLIMLDIDYFKQNNDEYGHIQGDECLKRIGRVLSLFASRARDFFARFGGEEFVLVLPETDELSAKKIAECCHHLIFKEKIPNEKSQISYVLTISLGVGTISPSHKDEAISFIEMVDKRLYQAKQKGRNCIITGS